MSSVDDHQGLGTLLRIVSIKDTLGSTEQRVASYILGNPREVIRLPITELAEKAEASEASVVRVCQKAGFKGYQDLKINLAQEIVSPLESIHEELHEGDDEMAVISKVFHATIQTLQFTLKVASAEALRNAVDRISQARIVDVYGLGNSASVAIDLHHKLSRSGIFSRVTTDNHVQMIHASTLTDLDVAIGISHSGSSRDIVEALETAKERGATVICITNYARSPIVRVSDISLFTASEETKFRVLGLASRIAQLAIIDTIHALLAVKDMKKSLDTSKTMLSSLQRKMY